MALGLKPHRRSVDSLEMTSVERSNPELRAAVILAGRRIVKLSLGRRNDPVLPILRRVLREARNPGLSTSSANLVHQTQLGRKT